MQDDITEPEEIKPPPVHMQGQTVSLQASGHYSKAMLTTLGGQEIPLTEPERLVDKTLKGQHSTRSESEVQAAITDVLMKDLVRCIPLLMLAENFTLHEIQEVYGLKVGIEAGLNRPSIVTSLNQEIERIEALLPSTYYADRELEFRVARLVVDWQRVIESNKRLEDAVAQLETDAKRMRSLLEANDILF